MLDLQAVDTGLLRLAHRRRTLPQLEVIAAHDAALARVADEAVLAGSEVRDLARAQTKMDGDVEQVRQRKTRDQQRLDAGTVSSAKELVDLQSEIVSLERRQSVLEDEELEIMQAREDAERRLADLERARAEASAGRAEAEAERAAAEAEIDAEVAAATSRRAELEPTLPAALLALYDTIRGQQAGIGAAALYRARCEGCHLELGAAELRELRVAPPELVSRCDNCRRILVRTPESGL